MTHQSPPAQASDCATCEGHDEVSVPASDEPMRAAFEAQPQIVNKTRMPDGTYNSIGVEGHWRRFRDAYQAGFAAASIAPCATADVERDAAHFGLFLQMLDKAHVKFSKGADNAINRVDFTVIVGNETTDTFRGRARDLFDQLAAIAATKGAKP